MNLREEKISSELLFDGRIIKVKKDVVTLPNGNTSTRECVEHNGGCAIVPITSDGMVLLVRQFRYPYDDVLLEIPAGKLEIGEDPMQCAVRELREEVGGMTDNIIDLGVVYPSPGYTNEKIRIYLATDVICGEPDPDEDEFLQVESYSLEDIMIMIESNEIKDGKTIIGIIRSIGKI